jgi:Leucine-rich repeat (LRR) protein
MKMKKYFYFCFIAIGFFMACSSRAIEIDPNIIIINDANFEKALIALKIDSDSTINGQIKKSDAVDVKILSLPNLQIKSLVGIEGFKSLNYLDFSLNQINSIDLSQNIELESLDCSSNQLTGLDLSKNLSLAALNCVGNQLKELNILSSQLYALNASNNILSTISVDVSARLSLLYLSNNQLKSINLINNPALSELKCDNNKLTSIDLSKNLKIRYLDISNNVLSSLDLCKNTEILKLICSSNDISKIIIPKKIQAMFINKTALIDSKTTYSTCD